ncbi:hypothetical protein LTV02_34645 [Nocardia yamanashiensis]|uniref:hypothetical protein n=1 Tax=Nocardia yamanashiensis TaxID=209247 RepID=UPI001E2C7D2E|nr:hypothetical protein [Nocardia yamanashiensis]UGT41043.1 hypothetical protein LTV02_34645 [Nocardia yamanashiensis]
MIRRTIALLSLTAVVTLAVSGCGTKDSGSPLPSFGPSVTPPAGSGPAAALDQVTLRNDLLDAGQLPSGYTAFPDPAPGSTSGAGSTTDPARCAKVLAPVADQAPGAAASAVAEFGGPNFASVDIDAASYANGGAAQAFSAVQSLLRECTKYSGTDADNTKVEFRLGGLEQPNAGDASIAFRVHTTSQGVTLYSAVSVILVGATVVQINMSGASEPDSQQLSALTAAQVRKLSGATGP